MKSAARIWRWLARDTDADLPDENGMTPIVWLAARLAGMMIRAMSMVLQRDCQIRKLKRENESLQRRLGRIEGGGSGTGRSTTPTCGSTEGEDGKRVDEIIRQSESYWTVESIGTFPMKRDDICPTCGQKIKPPPLTNAERQRRYRERKRDD